MREVATLWIRYEQHGELADLDRAVALSNSAIAAVPRGDHIAYGGLRCMLGQILAGRFQHTGLESDLDRAIDANIAAAAATTDLLRAERLSNLGYLLLLRYQRRGDAADLARAIEAGEAAVHGIPARRRAPPSYLGNLAISLQAGYERHGRIDELHRAIELNDAALAATAPDDPQRGMHLSNLANALRYRYERRGDPADLDRAVATGEGAVAATPGGSPHRAMYLSNLGAAVRVRHEARGDRTDLDRAIEVGEEAVAGTPLDHPNRAIRLSNLLAALQMRYVQRGALGDLDRAITLADAAVAATPTDHPDRARNRSNLGSALVTRYERTGAPADLDRAIELGERAVAGTPSDHPNRALRMSNLMNALRLRYAAQERLTDLERAVELGERAVAGTPPDHPNRAMYLTNLCGSLAHLYQLLHRPVDLQRAIEVGDAAVTATPSAHPKKALRLLNLGRTLVVSHELTQATADLARAVAAFRAASDMPVATTSLRLEAACEWGGAAMTAGDWPSAADGFAAAIELLGRLAPRSLGRADQEYWLAQYTGLGSLAAACCLQAGQLERAVQLWEQGRGVLLGQALDTRTDLGLLAQEFPRLAAEFVRLRDELDSASVSDRHSPSVAETGIEPDPLGQPATQPAPDRRLQLAEQFDQLIALIRAQPGFDRFLLPLSVDELLAATADGPIVMINLTPVRSDAFLLMPSGVHLVPLPSLTPQAVHDAAHRFLTALDDIHHRYEGADGRERAEHQLTGVLGWLWDAVAGPVLERLDDQTSTGSPPARPPRLWWCPTGILSLLPLHAAGHHDTHLDPVPRTVVDRVVSAYTPTVRALIHGRRPRPGGHHEDLRSARLLVVSMPTTPALGDLPAVTAESAMLARMFPQQTQVLSGPGATFESVAAALRSTAIAHFACHAISHASDPSASRLLLHDHHDTPLTVLDLARLRLDDAELAYLSACETARTGPALGDEAIHLAAACQVAGYRHVIATLWPIRDAPAVGVAADFYAFLAGHGVEAAAFALHTAIRRLRDRHGARPSDWAAYVCYGS